MTVITPAGATIPGVTHHRADVNGAQLHYVSAGASGSPVLLIHGWPETWWAFRKVIPLLAATHRVFAVDLRGFGDSSTTDGSYDAATSAEDMHHLVEHLGAGRSTSCARTSAEAPGSASPPRTPPTSSASPRSRRPWPASGSNCSRTSPMAAPGTSGSSPRLASPRSCSPATNASSSPAGPTP